MIIVLHERNSIAAFIMCLNCLFYGAKCNLIVQLHIKKHLPRAAQFCTENVHLLTTACYKHALTG